MLSLMAVLARDWACSKVGADAAIAVVGGPVKVAAVVLVGDEVLRLIAADVDVSEGMGHCVLGRLHLGQSRFAALHGRGLVFVADGNHHRPDMRHGLAEFVRKTGLRL